MVDRRDIQNARKQLGLDRLPAVLGNGSGQPRTADGMYWARKIESGGLSDAVKLPLAAGVSIRVVDGVPCEIGWDEKRRQVIYPAGAQELLTAGSNPLIYNPLDSIIQAPICTSDFPPFLCNRHGDTVNKPLTVIVYVPPVANADGTVTLPEILEADLTSFVPASDLHCFAIVFWLDDNTLEVKASTPVSLLDPLTNTDLEECIAASTAGSIPVRAWILEDDQSVLSPNPAKNMDMRQFIRTSMTANMIISPVTSVSTNTTLTTAMHVVLVTATATITLLNAVTNLGRHYVVKNMGAAVTVTIDTESSQTIDGNLTLVITDQYVSVTLCSDGANWVIL